MAKENDFEYLMHVRDEVLSRVLADIASRGMKLEATLLAAALGLRQHRRGDLEHIATRPGNF